MSGFAAVGQVIDPSTKNPLLNRARPATYIVVGGNSIEGGQDGYQNGSNVTWVGYFQSLIGAYAVMKCYATKTRSGTSNTIHPSCYSVGGGTLEGYLQGAAFNGIYLWNLDAYAERADYAIMPGGENSLPGTGTNWTSTTPAFLTFMRNYIQYCQFAIASGSIPICRTPIQTSNKSIVSTAVVADAIRTLARSRGYILADVHADWVANGSHGLNAYDGTHPNRAGVILIATTVANALLPHISRNGFTVPQFTGQSGTIGVVWNATASTPINGGYGFGSAAGTGWASTTDTTFPGEGTVYTATKTAGAASNSWMLNQDNVGPEGASTWAVGDALLFGHWCKCENVMGSNNFFQDVLDCIGSTGTPSRFIRFTDVPPEGVWVYQSLLFKVPAGTTRINHKYLIQAGTGGHTGGQTARVWMGGRTMINLTRLGLDKAWQLD